MRGRPKIQFRCSIVVSISACHAEDPGSIPGGGSLICSCWEVGSMVCARINHHTSATISASDREPRTGWNRLTGIISLAAASSVGQRASTSQPSKPARNQAQSEDLKGPPLLCKRCAYKHPRCRSNPRPQGPGSRALPTELWEWPMGGGLCSSVA